MIQTSEYFKKAIKRPNRDIRSKATIENIVLDDRDILSFTIDEGITSEEDFNLGSVPSSYLELTLNNAHKKYTDITFEGKEIALEIGIVLFIPSRDIEYVQMGLFMIDEASKPAATITLKGFDRMMLFETPYTTNLVFPATLLQIAQDICSKIGVTLAITDFPNKDYIVTDKPVLEDISCRQAISYVASLAASNARINRQGELEFVWIEDTDLVINKSNYMKFTKADNPIQTITKVIVQNGEEIATMGTGEAAITIKDNLFCLNPYTAVNDIYNRVNGLSYMPYSGIWQGDPSVLAGDKVLINDGNSNYNTIITNQKIIYKGGLKTEIQAVGRSSTAKEYDRKGNMQIAIDKVKTELKVVSGEISMRVTQGDFDSYVQQTATQITSKVSNLDFESYKIQTANEITQKISDSEGRMSTQITQKTDEVSVTAANNLTNTKAELDGKIVNVQNEVNDVKLQITPTAITLSVRQSLEYQNDLGGKASTDSVNSLGTRVSTAESSISQNAYNIGLKVAKDGVIGAINVSSESIVIQASKIGILGDVNIPTLSGDKIKYGTIEGANIKGNIILCTGVFRVEPVGSNYYATEAKMEFYNGPIGGTGYIKRFGGSFFTTDNWNFASAIISGNLSCNTISCSNPPWATSSHNHDGVYSSIYHSHSEYSSIYHGHSGYAASSHYHNEFDQLAAFCTSLDQRITAHGI